MTGWMANIKELVLFTVDIRGINFYEGHADLKATEFLHMDLVKEESNPHGANSILIVTQSKTPKIH